MKRCPQCHRFEPDDALAFCRSDGSVLVGDDSPPGGEAGTARLGTTASEIETSILPHTTDAAMSRASAPTTSASLLRPTGATRELSRPKRRALMAGALLAASLLAVAGYFYLTRKEQAAIESIAVLPFVNESGNTDAEYLSDGMTETLIGSLSQLPNLNVKARSSVFRYKGKETNAQTVGKELNVQAILTGRVVQRGRDLILYLELVDTQTGNQIWGAQYNREQADLISLQSEIAWDVSNKLRVKLSGADEQKLAKNYTVNPEAYQLYLKGRFHWNKRTEEGFKKAIEYFERAIVKDPKYALAYSGLADSYNLLSVFGFIPPREAMPKAKDAALKALEIDDELAEAHASLGAVLMDYEWKFTEGESEYKRAIELNPNYATAHQWYAELLSALGRHEEAIREIKRAQELDPLSLIINRVFGSTLYNSRQYDRAIEQLQKTIEMDANFPSAHNWLGVVYGQRGMYADAITEYQKAMDLYGVNQTQALGQMGHLYALAGKRAEALKVLDQLKETSKRKYVEPASIALIYIGLNDKDQAFYWLEKGYADRNQKLVALKVDPRYDSLRDDPRLNDLVRRVGLAQ